MGSHSISGGGWEGGTVKYVMMHFRALYIRLYEGQKLSGGIVRRIRVGEFNIFQAMGGEG